MMRDMNKCHGNAWLVYSFPKSVDMLLLDDDEKEEGGTSLYCDISPHHDERPWGQNNKLEVAFEEYHTLLSNITIHMALVNSFDLMSDDSISHTRL